MFADHPLIVGYEPMILVRREYQIFHGFISRGCKGNPLDDIIRKINEVDLKYHIKLERLINTCERYIITRK